MSRGAVRKIKPSKARKPRILVIDHHGKSQMLREILSEEGWLTGDFDTAQVIVADTDHPDAPPVLVNDRPVPRRQILEWAKREGKKVALYPHGANPQLDYDGLLEPAPWVDVQFVHGEGHLEAYDLIDLDRRIEVFGWSYTPWEQTQGEHHVLFAPIHPWADGKRILPVHRKANEEAYGLFLSLDADRKTVRMWGEYEPNGILIRPGGIEFLPSDLRIPLDLIDSASRVIASNTIAYTALARGKLVDMIDVDIPFMDDFGQKVIDHWDQIAPIYRYVDSKEWAERWVGGPFKRDVFLDVLESL